MTTSGRDLLAKLDVGGSLEEYILENNDLEGLHESAIFNRCLSEPILCAM